MPGSIFCLSSPSLQTIVQKKANMYDLEAGGGKWATSVGRLVGSK